LLPLVEKTYSLQQCQGILGQMFLRGKKNVANISLFLSAKSHMGYLRQLYREAWQEGRQEGRQEGMREGLLAGIERQSTMATHLDGRAESRFAVLAIST
jgi:predicted transposase YdaD